MNLLITQLKLNSTPASKKNSKQTAACEVNAVCVLSLPLASGHMNVYSRARLDNTI